MPDFGPKGEFFQLPKALYPPNADGLPFPAGGCTGVHPNFCDDENNYVLPLARATPDGQLPPPQDLPRALIICPRYFEGGIQEWPRDEQGRSGPAPQVWGTRAMDVVPRWLLLYKAISILALGMPRKCPSTTMCNKRY